MSISQWTHQLVNVSHEFTSILPILIQYYLGSFYLSIFATPFPTMRNLTRIILNINLCPGWTFTPPPPATQAQNTTWGHCPHSRWWSSSASLCSDIRHFLPHPSRRLSSLRELLSPWATVFLPLVWYLPCSEPPQAFVLNVLGGPRGEESLRCFLICRGEFPFWFMIFLCLT